MRLRLTSVLALAVSLLTLTRCAPPDAAAELDVALAERSQALSPGGGLRVMTYNIKHGEVSSLEAVASVITSREPAAISGELKISFAERKTFPPS